MRNASVKTAPWIVQIAALFGGGLNRVFGPFLAADALWAWAFRWRRFSRFSTVSRHMGSKLLRRRLGRRAGLVDGWGPVLRRSRTYKFAKQTWIDKPGPRNVRWRKIFLLSRFNSRYKQSPFHPTL